MSLRKQFLTILKVLCCESLFLAKNKNYNLGCEEHFNCCPLENLYGNKGFNLCRSIEMCCFKKLNLLGTQVLPKKDPLNGTSIFREFFSKKNTKLSNAFVFDIFETLYIVKSGTLNIVT